MKRFVIRRAVVTAVAASIAVAAAPRTEASLGNHSVASSAVLDEHDVVGLGWSIWKAIKCGTCIGVALTPSLPVPIEACARWCRA